MGTTTKDTAAFSEEVEKQMADRVDKFLGALKDPDKKLTPDPNVKHDVCMVDTQSFNPHTKVHVDEEEVTFEENHAVRNQVEKARKK